MNGFTRFCGYLGLAVFVGSVGILALVPAGRHAPSSVRDSALAAAVAGYFLVIGRLGYLSATAEGRRTRWISRVAMFSMVIGACLAFRGDPAEPDGGADHERRIKPSFGSWRARLAAFDPATLRPSLTAGPVRPANRSREAGKEADDRVSARPPSPSGRWRFHVRGP